MLFSNRTFSSAITPRKISDRVIKWPLKYLLKQQYAVDILFYSLFRRTAVFDVKSPTGLSRCFRLNKFAKSCVFCIRRWLQPSNCWLTNYFILFIIKRHKRTQEKCYFTYFTCPFVVRHCFVWMQTSDVSLMPCWMHIIREHDDLILQRDSEVHTGK